MTMRIVLPDKVKFLIDRLNQCGYEAYAVGGCIRDSLLMQKPKDWDITTSALPAQVKKVFPHTVDTGIAHGTVTVLLGREGFEVTTYRIDGEYEDARHPKDVFFTSNLYEDLKRRDFTINAMAYNDSGGLVDAFDGTGDLRDGVIRCVGDADERFAEDALRMLRAVRFAAQLNFRIDRSTEEAIKRRSKSIGMVSAERISAELVKLLVSDHPGQLLKAYETGLTSVFLPEFDVMMQTEQNHPHHCLTVGMHTLETIRHVPPKKTLRLAALLHDIAKPECRTMDAAGIHHFRGHPLKGEEMARQILRRLKFDNDTIRQVTKLVRYHDDNPPLSAACIRRALNRAGQEAYPDLFALKRADIMAQSTLERESKLACVDEYEKIYNDIIEKKECITVSGLAVNGSDLIAAGMRPGKEIGETLRRLLELVMEDPAQNTRENLLEHVIK